MKFEAVIGHAHDEDRKAFVRHVDAKDRRTARAAALDGHDDGVILMLESFDERDARLAKEAKRRATEAAKAETARQEADRMAAAAHDATMAAERQARADATADAASVALAPITARRKNAGKRRRR